MLTNISRKKQIPAYELLKRNKVKDTLDNIFSIENDDKLKLAFGHVRLVTNGTQLEAENNHCIK